MLRRSVAAAAAAVGLMLATATPSHAAIGEFRYTVVDLQNLQVQKELLDPPSVECINLDIPASNLPALLGRNLTDSTATLFNEADCDGDTYWVVNPGGRSPALARFRSVVFN
ncbi:hypothetical protein [Streptomyces sp. NPDC090112]|uniref:hypothetical protein n=1 Tax=Streptomyces sp. NPDC090112 TaxID=3365949 RepID=UPI00380AE425